MLEINAKNLGQAAAAHQRLQSEERKGAASAEATTATDDKVSISSRAGQLQNNGVINDSETAQQTARGIAEQIMADGAAALRAFGNANDSRAKLLEAA